jgi:hypothetical protein
MMGTRMLRASALGGGLALRADFRIKIGFCWLIFYLDIVQILLFLKFKLALLFP